MRPRAQTLKAIVSVRRFAVAGAALSFFALAAVAQAQKFSPPNEVVISDRLITSGQPSAAALATLQANGFQAVINLSPPTVPNAVRDEGAILEHQGIAYINIPIDFDNPTQADFETFIGSMAAMGNRKVLVHCQVNMRASAFVFLYRVIVSKERPEKAYEAVTKVWSPSGRWKQLLLTQLRTHGSTFEPY